MSRPIEFHPDAAAEYEAAVTWYLEQNSVAASKFAEEIGKALDLVSAAPQRWPAHPHGTRRFLLRHFPFAIVYRTLPSVVQIVAVAHGRRRPGYWEDRL